VRRKARYAHRNFDFSAGKLEIRPGLSNVLKAVSRIAPQSMLNQTANTETQEVTGP
jgi:hypothetical protein